MRGLRSTIALIVVFGGLLGYIYFVTWKAPADTPSKPKVFASLEAEKIGELRIKGSAGETTLRKLNGQWEIVEPLSTRADSQEASTITSKFQVVIPRKIRERYKLKPGYKVVFIPFENTLRLVFAPPIEQARGMFPGIDTTVEREEEDRV